LIRRLVNLKIWRFIFKLSNYSFSN